jgi:hypothetical protein
VLLWGINATADVSFTEREVRAEEENARRWKTHFPIGSDCRLNSNDRAGSGINIGTNSASKPADGFAPVMGDAPPSDQAR